MKKNVYKPKFDDDDKAIIALIHYYERKIQSSLNNLFNDDFSVQVTISKPLKEK